MYCGDSSVGKIKKNSDSPRVAVWYCLEFVFDVIECRAYVAGQCTCIALCLSEIGMPENLGDNVYRHSLGEEHRSCRGTSHVGMEVVNTYHRTYDLQIVVVALV